MDNQEQINALIIQLTKQQQELSKKEKLIKDLETENIKLKKVCKKPKMFIANTIKKTNGKHNTQDIIEQIGS